MIPSFVLRTSDQSAFACYGAFSAFIYAIPIIGVYFAGRITANNRFLVTNKFNIIFYKNAWKFYYGKPSTEISIR